MIKKLKGVYETKAIFFIGFLISYSIILVALNSMPVRLDTDKIFLFSLITWIIVFFIKPINKLISITLLLIQLLWSFSFVYLIPTVYKMGLDNALPGSSKFAEFIYSKLFGAEYFKFINWVRNFLLINDYSINNLYYNIFNIFIISAVMIIIMGLIEKRVNWKIFLILSSYFIVAWFIYVSNIKSYFSMYFLGITIYRQYLIYDKQVSNAKEKGERTRYYNYSSAILVGSILMTIVLLISNLTFLFLPVDKINAKVNTVVPKSDFLRSDYKTIRGSKIFNFSSTMYSPNSDILGGPILERDYSVIMRLRANAGSMYLRGRVKNIYDGSKWTSDFETFKNNISVSENSIPEDKLEEIILFPDTLSSRTIFTPYKYYSSSFQKHLVYGNEDSIVYRKNRSSVSLERYSVKFIKEEFVSEFDTLDEEYIENYLDLPSTGLTNTKALTLRITNALDTDYEKMKAIEEYLRDNYRYTLITNEVIPDSDFVENFLFDEKKGYCTYFASALAVMGRAADIPTRYVEGFITSDFADYKGFYEVSANRAHAWVEAYIDGKGWVRFEATPAYSNGAESESEDESDDSLEGMNGVTSDDNFDDARLQQKEEELEGNPSAGISSTLKISDIILVLIYLILFIGTIYIVYSKINRYKKDMLDGDYNTKIRNRVNYILSMITLFDEEMDITELPTHVISRTSSQYLEVDIDEKIINYVNLSLYSNHDFTEEQFNEFNEFFVYYENLIKVKISRISYYMTKIIFNTLYHSDYYKE